MTDHVAISLREMCPLRSGTAAAPLAERDVYVAGDRSHLPALAAYPAWLQSATAEPLENAGGFSGARLWRLHTLAGDFCLRQWPAEHPDRRRLEWIHAVLAHAARRGVCVTAPLPARDGRTFVESGGHFWEVSPWLPGVADFRDRPTPERLQAALTTLARFHCAVADGPSILPATAAPHGPAPALRERSERLRRLLLGGRTALVPRANDWPALLPLANETLQLFDAAAPAIAVEVDAAVHVAVPLLPCLRDVWHDHVLFVGDRVTGLIDFGALRHDSPACDIARLLGSLVGDDAAGWSLGLAAYESVRGLTDAERRLVPLCDRTTVLLSGLSWLEWIYVEHRAFDRARVMARLGEILARLRKLGLR